jgi:LacI family transcriptional regulator
LPIDWRKPRHRFHAIQAVRQRQQIGLRLIQGERMAIPKLKDIAEATGLHTMTVSRALRNVGRMRPETRQRALDAACKLGYRPNAAAAAMRTGHTGCIVLISSTRPQAPLLPPPVLAAILEAVAGHGGFLAHAAFAGNGAEAGAAPMPALLRRHMAEGVLLNGTQDAPPQLEDFLRRNGLPAVWMNCKRSSNAVYPDDAGAARKATAQLLALGHARIAFVRPAPEPGRHPPDSQSSVADRVAGYGEAMRQADLPPEVLALPRHWDQWDKPIASRLGPLAGVLVDPARRPTALITCSDGPVMLGLLNGLGLQVPGDVSLVSFSGSASPAVEQMVSRVPLPCEAMGRKAVAMLFQMIESGTREVPAIALPYGEIASLHTVRKLG